MHAPGGIRTRSLSGHAAADLRLRSRGHWDRRKTLMGYIEIGVSLSICWSPVTALFAIQGYQFCELCRGIVNYSVQIFMYLHMTSKYLDAKNYKDKRNSVYDSQLSHTTVYYPACILFTEIGD